MLRHLKPCPSCGDEFEFLVFRMEIPFQHFLCKPCRELREEAAIVCDCGNATFYVTYWDSGDPEIGNGLRHICSDCGEDKDIEQ